MTDTQTTNATLTSPTQPSVEYQLVPIQAGKPSEALEAYATSQERITWCDEQDQDWTTDTDALHTLGRYLDNSWIAFEDKCKQRDLRPAVAVFVGTNHNSPDEPVNEDNEEELRDKNLGPTEGSDGRAQEGNASADLVSRAETVEEMAVSRIRQSFLQYQMETDEVEEPTREGIARAYLAGRDKDDQVKAESESLTFILGKEGLWEKPDDTHDDAYWDAEIATKWLTPTQVNAQVDETDKPSSGGP